MSIDFAISPQIDLENAIAILSPGQLGKIYRSAVRETTRTIRTQISRDVRGILNLSKAEADQDIKISIQQATGEVVVSRTPQPLKVYDPKWRGPQGPAVSVRARQYRGRETVAHAFLVYKIAGNVFVRGRYKHNKFGGPTRRVRKINPRTGRVYYSELPINKQYGPTVLGVIANRPGVLEVIIDNAQETLNSRLESKISFVISGGTVGINPSSENPSS